MWRRRLRSAHPKLVALSAGAIAVALIPLAYLAVRAGEVGWARIVGELATRRVGELAFRSLALSAVVTVASVAVGVGIAFVVTRTDLPGRRGFAVAAALPLAIPTYVAAFSWVSTVESFNGFWATATVLTLCSYPYAYLPAAAAFVRADPSQEEVSRSLGYGWWRTFRRVTLRQIRPAVAAGALLVALYVLSDFGAVSILRAETFTRAIFTALELGFDRTGALVLSTVLVALTLVFLGGELLARDPRARYVSHGRPPSLVSLRAARWPVAALLVGWGFLALGVPGWSLLHWLGAGVSSPGSLAAVGTAAGNSLLFALSGTVLTMLLALPVGVLTGRWPGKIATVIDRMAYLAHALPGLVIGLSLVSFGIHVARPLYQTEWLLALAYATLFLPLAVSAVSSAAAQSPPGLEEVARSLGSGPLTVLRTITLPRMAPGIGAGAALVFLASVKELPATLMLRPTGADTLATSLWTQTSTASYAAAAPYAALLVLLAAIPTWLLTVRSGITDVGRL